MSLQPVDVYISDNHDAPVSGVTVRVYNEDATSFITQSSTDVDGHAGFLLESADGPFQLRFFKTLYSFSNPLHIVVSELEANTFDVPCLTLDAPIPTDPRYCIAYGHFRDPSGGPARGVRIDFVPEFNPTLLEGLGVLPERVSVSTNEVGYAQVHLIRNAKYKATITSRQDYAQAVAVPDQPNVKLPDLLFPLVDSITFDPAIPVAMVAGSPDVEIEVTIMRTDLNEAGFEEVQWSSSNSNVLGVIPSNGKLTLRPLAAGTAEVRAVRTDNSVVRIPDPGISGVPVTVVVS